MKARVLTLATIFIASLAISINAMAQGASNDLVILSNGWWGTSIDDFLKKAGLKPGEYSAGDHPSEKGVKVIIVNMQAAAKWEPKELPAHFFYFRATTGLYDISEFIKGTPEEVFEVLKKRYGQPARGSQAIGMKAYGWDFEKTTLQLRHNLYQLKPREK